MYRNRMSSWWTVTLACVLGFACSFASPVLGVTQNSSYLPGGGSNPSPSTDPVPITSGDPDSPSNTGKPSTSATAIGSATSTGQATLGPQEYRPAAITWVFKIRIALQMMRVFYLRD